MARYRAAWGAILGAAVLAAAAPGPALAQALPSWDDDGFDAPAAAAPASPEGGEPVPAPATPTPAPADPSPPLPEADDVPAAPPGPCAEGPLVDAELAGCRAPGCESAAFRAAVLDLADLVPGTVYDGAREAAGLRRLSALGAFRSASVACHPVVGGVSATLTVEVARRVRNLKVKGNTHFDDGPILERLVLQRGDRFDLRDPQAAESLDRAKEAIRRAYQDDGFLGTVVTVRTTKVGTDQMDLEVDIQEGSRVKIRAVDAFLRPARPAEGSSAGGVEGCPAVRPRDLRKWSGLSAGDTLTERTLPEAVRRLTRALRTVGFTAVRVGATFDATSQSLRLDATYDACWLLRFYDRDREVPGRLGFRPLASDSLLQALPFGDSGSFDLTEATLGREEVRTWFENRGHLFANVVLEHRTRRTTSVLDDEDVPVAPEDDVRWGPHVAGRISYFITRNSKVEIRRLVLEGVKALDPDRLEEAMDTRPYDFFGDTGAVLPDQVFADLDKVRRIYRDEGFADMKFRGTVDGVARVRLTTAEGPRSVYTYASGDKAFQVVVHPGATEGVTLRISIDEGTRRTVGAVALEGVVSRPVEKAREVLDLPPGGPLSASRLGAAVARLQRWYAAAGFLRTRVTVACGAGDPPVPCDLSAPAGIPAEGLRIVVDEGTPTRVGAVMVLGLGRTRRSVVLSELPAPGDPYDVGRVAEGVRFLNDLGIFSSVQVSAVGAEEDPPRERVVLVVECREQTSRFIDLSVGFETLNDERSEGNLPKIVGQVVSTSVGVTDQAVSGAGRSLDLPLPDILLTVEARYVDQNFLGRAKRLYLPVKYGLSFTAWDRYASFTPTFLDPHFFTKNLSFRVTPFAVYDRATTRLDQVRLGGEFALSRQLVPHLFGSLLWETGAVRIRDPALSSSYGPWRYENKVVPALTYDRLDHPINPQNGGMVQVSLAYINALDQGNFLKYEVLAKGFVTIRRFLTIGLTGRLGGSRAFGNQGRLPAEERFTLGGNRGVRGFANDGVAQYAKDGSLRLDADLVEAVNEDGTPKTDPETGAPVLEPKYRKVPDGDAVVAGSLELRFPILRSLDVHGAVFYDVGALAESLDELHPRSFRQSVGVGLRWLLGGMVPLRLDYGIILDRRCKDVDPRTGKCSKREEFGNIHFGVLYTF